ncbi:DUF2977 domain-containing protein [Staphylococcus arlettae]|uniref:DUF2977 domain-containing protein n=1 Tax=Staphylococcus arlettae TaxID=29378 RepID=UPI0021D229D7|nr:DUF2977 domain-containing protein [Staphylococcus arlettae]UXU53217.1 DUF2977 domain-containing protein [Staphylococcus arlettae]
MIVNTDNQQYNEELNIKVNEQNEITQYAVIGGVGDGGIFIPYSEVPEDFRDNFDRGYYLYKDGKITVNTDYVAPEREEL